MKYPLSVEVIRSIFEYSEEAGGLIWRVAPARAVKIGTRAGTPDKEGYKRVCFKRHFYREHRLVWAHQTGGWPSGQIDHINGDRADNRLSNLRDVSASVNQQNRRKAQRTNVSGVLGAHLRKNGTYQPKIKINGRTVALGTFKTAAEAHAEFVRVKAIVHEGYVP